ncbi:MAG: Transcriptional regulator, AraC family, partial [Thermoleophilia bacterium]|nr:Transcriptional regulator, AraC family [Thermoleophilia bacterium]
DELRRPPDPVTDRIVAASLDSLLALAQRWRASEQLGAGGGSGTDADGTLLRQFGRLLEAEFEHHHDAGWYASQLHVSANHLAAVLSRMTGRSTKRLITDRIMVEAQRLLRYTDLTVQQVAQRLGFDDPLYLSRAFKAHTGESPTLWRSSHQRVE